MIENSFIYDGKTGFFRWFDCDDVSVLARRHVTQVYAVAITDENKAVLVFNGKSGEYQLPGGSTEKGESIEDTMRRELHEETNTEVVSWKMLGYQEVHIDGLITAYQVRVIARVRQKNDMPFRVDPDGNITRNVQILIGDCNKYLKWGSICDYFIGRAEEIIKSRVL